MNGGPGTVICVRPDGSAIEVAAGMKWPNGMALFDDGRTLVVADSHAKQLLAFQVAADGTLSRVRVWAELEHAPDGICADADGAVWVARPPASAAYADQKAAKYSLPLPSIEVALLACSVAETGGHCLSVPQNGAAWR